PRGGPLQGRQARGGGGADDGGPPARHEGRQALLSRGDDLSEPGSSGQSQRISRPRPVHQHALTYSSCAAGRADTDGARNPVRAPPWPFAVGLASLLVAGVLLTPRQGLAHPMGNSSISHYAGIRLAATEIELRYLLDMAEIPTFQELQDSGLTPEAAPSIVEGDLARKDEPLKDNLYLEVNGQRLVLVTSSRDLLFSPGAGGLPTMKLGILYRASLTTATPPAWHRVLYRDENFLERAGWKEVVAVPSPGVVLASSSVPEQDRSRQLAD